MQKLKNDRLIRALLRQPVDQIPVWIMRQAGRYLPEYRSLRQQAPDFMSFCKNPELACEATLQPLRRFPLDAAIVFSDILTIPDAMGMQLEFISGKGPVIHNPVRDEKGLQQLVTEDVLPRLDYVGEAIERIKQALAAEIPLIGFAGSPWTVACYMVEGSGSKTFNSIRTMLYHQPDLLQRLLNKITILTIDYLKAQIAAGADVIMLFDTWGGLLTPKGYQHFSLQFMQKIAQQLKKQPHEKIIPMVFFTKNSGQWLEVMADSDCDAVGLDWTIDLKDAGQRIGDKVALQGNLDPMVLMADKKRVISEVEAIMQIAQHFPGYVFNLGHGIDKDTPPENVATLVKTVQQFKK